MNVLSLFDGISCGQEALKKLEIKVENYFASEIDGNAIKVTQHNFPNTIQLGDVTLLKEKELEKLPKIDLLIGGSPCQGFSFAGKGLNFEDKRSKLFFDFVRILDLIKPTYFFLENVVMKQEYQNIISNMLGVEPIEINSNLVSAQNRRRLYWTNLPIGNKEDFIKKIKDKNISLKEVIDYSIPLRNGKGECFANLNIGRITGRKFNERGVRDDYNKNLKITQTLEVRRENLKSNCLTTVDKDNVLTPLSSGRYIDVYNKNLPFRYLSLKEYCKLQTLPENYFYNNKGELIISESQAKKAVGNGWTVNVICLFFNTLKTQD